MYIVSDRCKTYDNGCNDEKRYILHKSVRDNDKKTIEDPPVENGRNVWTKLSGVAASWAAAPEVLRHRKMVAPKRKVNYVEIKGHKVKMNESESFFIIANVKF